MSGCHVPLVEKVQLEEVIFRLQELESKIDSYLIDRGNSLLPEAICDKCNGKGSFVDDGIL
jgi:hypothetical protein